MNTSITAGFIGAGGIARPHAFALNSVRYYYNDSPAVRFAAVSSATEKSRDAFAARFGFEKSLPPGEFFKNNEIDTVYILGPNKVHFEHISEAARMRSVKRIYIEKPVCSTVEEENQLTEIAASRPDIKFQVGFQYLFMTSIRDALKKWKTGIFGKPLHFDFRYYHGDYLLKAYRDKRTNRLTPAPDGGAMADLGSHVVSLMIAFLGNNLKIHNAMQSGSFPDVNKYSDLYSQITVEDLKTGAAGTLSSSRIASGSGDLLTFDIYAEKGSINFSTSSPSCYTYYSDETGRRAVVDAGSSYPDITSFPSGHVPPGWLRPMIHAHYTFLGGKDNDAFIPDLAHGLQVQRIVRETASILRTKADSE